MLPDKNQNIAPDDGFSVIMELTSKEKLELIKLWRDYIGKKQRTDY